MTIREEAIACLIFVGLKFSAILLARILWTLQLYATERIFVARQAIIVRNIRAVQRLFLFPRILWIVSEEEPGLSRHAIRNSANGLAIPFGISAVTLFICWLDGINILQGPWTIILGIVLPISSVLGVWYVLAARQYALSTHPEKNDLERGDAKPCNDMGLDEDGVRIIKNLWTQRNPDIFTGQSRRPPDGIPPSSTHDIHIETAFMPIDPQYHPYGSQ